MAKRSSRRRRKRRKELGVAAVKEKRSPAVRPLPKRGRAEGYFEVEIVVSNAPLRDPATEALPAKVKRRLPQLLFAQQIDARLAMEELKYYAILYPEVPCFENWLAKGLHEVGRQEEARALAERTLKRHPDYFFGILLVAQFALWDGDLERSSRLLGWPRVPQSLAPARKVFHTSEVLGYLDLCMQHELIEGDLEGARASLELIKEIAPKNPLVRELEERCEAFEAKAAPSAA